MSETITNDPAMGQPLDTALNLSTPQSVASFGSTPNAGKEVVIDTLAESAQPTMSHRRHTATEDEKASLRTLLSAIEPFRLANPTMSIQQMVTFILVALEEGKQVTDYARKAGLAQGVMTRNLLDLGEYNRRREPGLQLVEQKPDLNDRRAHLTSLTHKGRQLVGMIHRTLAARP